MTGCEGIPPHVDGAVTVGLYSDTQPMPVHSNRSNRTIRVGLWKYQCCERISVSPCTHSRDSTVRKLDGECSSKLKPDLCYEKSLRHRFTSFFIFFLVPCFNFKVQREKELFVLNCPSHDSKLSEIDYDDRSEEEQHRNNNFLQTFCQKNVKSKNFRKSGGTGTRFRSQNLRRGNRGFRRSGGSTSFRSCYGNCGSGNSAFVETPKFVSV